MLWLLFNIYFLVQQNCRMFLPEHWNTIIKQQLCQEEWYHIELIKFCLFCCHLCSLCSKLMLFYTLQFLLVSDLVIKVIPPKDSQECTAILQLKVDNVYVVRKLVGYPSRSVSKIWVYSFFHPSTMQVLWIISFFLFFSLKLAIIK